MRVVNDISSIELTKLLSVAEYIIQRFKFLSSLLDEGFRWSSDIFGVFERLDVSMLFVIVDLLDFEESVNLVKVRISVSFVNIFVVVFLLDKNVPKPLFHLLIINKFVNSTSLYFNNKIYHKIYSS